MYKDDDILFIRVYLYILRYLDHNEIEIIQPAAFLGLSNLLNLWVRSTIFVVTINIQHIAYVYKQQY